VFCQKQSLYFNGFQESEGRLKCIFLFCCLLGVSNSSGFAQTPKTKNEAAVSQMGRWIWTDTTADKQTCRLWRSFEIPNGAVVSRATLYITVDNGFRLLLDGEEIGQGSDWRCISVFDLTWFLKPGHHVVAVEGFNDSLRAGLNFGLSIELADRDSISIVSDEAWRIAPSRDKKWAKLKQAPEDWPAARIVGGQRDSPWDIWPKTIASYPPLHPPVRYFWQAAWFQLTLAIVCGAAILTGLWLFTRVTAQNKAQRLLQQERVRIAQDIHDDIGSRVTELLLLGEVSRRERPANPDPSGNDQMHEICEQARGLSLALDEVVWAVNAKRDTVRDFTSYVCKHAQAFLKTAAIRCRLDVEADIPASALALHVRRNLFLAVKEALNNAAKHSRADELYLRIYRRNHRLFVEVADNGCGFDAQQALGERNGLANMWQRLGEIHGTCEILSEPGAGCQVVFSVPMARERRHWWRKQPTGG
jgi:two-component sensor histidine kinase